MLGVSRVLDIYFMRLLKVFQRTKKPGESRTGQLACVTRPVTMTVLELNPDLVLPVPSPVPCAVGLQSEVRNESRPVAQVKRVARMDNATMTDKAERHAVTQQIRQIRKQAFWFAVMNFNRATHSLAKLARVAVSQPACLGPFSESVFR